MFYPLENFPSTSSVTVLNLVALLPQANEQKRPPVDIISQHRSPDTTLLDREWVGDTY